MPEMPDVMRGRVIMHVDMDAFYASAEAARNPRLRTVPFWVGGAERGVVLSANYLARTYGVSGGMASTRARRLCPAGVAVPPDFDHYGAVSAGVFALFDQITDRVEAASIDEAYLDITGSQRRLGSPRLIGENVRARVADEQHITCSVGIAQGRALAKLASNRVKPDGLLVVDPGEVVALLHPLPVEQLSGVGPATASTLHKLGLSTVGQVAHTPVSTLRRALGARAGQWLSDLSWGHDESLVVGQDRERSIGSQTTFARDTDDPEQVGTELLRMAARTAGRMRASGLCGRTVVLDVRFADFTTITRSGTLRDPTDVTDEIYARARKLFESLGLQRARIRRVGVRVEGLVPSDQAYRQPALDEPERGMRQVELAADDVVYRFGAHAAQRARLTRRTLSNPESGSPGITSVGGTA
ncbi:DNA polymerase IV [Propionibacterium freudenreichii]|uniref:DNA polymerase IV n=1 Tax=Propionibacterium freudenreichii TaxID=1744 RepID=UPI00254D1F58|nr:DNA polymerase IV [Propionibacterium freudenreichii]